MNQNAEITINLTRLSHIIKRKFWAISIPSVLIALAVGLTGKFLIHKQYDATVAILPPSGGQLSIPFGSVIKNLLPGGMSIGGTGTKEVIALLESRRMAEDVINKFNLMEYFKTKKLDKAIKRLNKIVKIKISDETGVIYIRVRTKSPAMSAQMANFYVTNLEKLNDELKISVTKPFVKVLDPARPPDIKAWPKNAINTIITFILLVLFLTTYFIYKEYTNPFVRDPEAFTDEFEILGLIPSQGLKKYGLLRNRILSFLTSPVAVFPVMDNQRNLEEIRENLGNTNFIYIRSPLENPGAREKLKEVKGFLILAEFNRTPSGALIELKNLLNEYKKVELGLVIYNIPYKFIPKKYLYLFPELRREVK